MLTKRWYSVFLVWLMVGLSTDSAQAAKKNIVLFVTDDQSQDAGCYGNPVIQTPNIDKLAADGTLFRYAFSTTASCSASRSVILTGLHNHANGHYGHQHNYHKFNSYGNVLTLPVYLEAAGYRTALCGKYHVSPPKLYRFQTTINTNSRNTVQMANRCEKFIREASNQPFFLYFCTSDPHRSGGFADELSHKPNRFGNPPPGKTNPGVEEVVYHPDDVVVHPFLPDTPTSRAEIAQYYQSVSRVDQGLGRLIEVLQEAGVWNDTLLIYISDHGIAMPNAKTTLYEGGMLSPCVVRNPYLEKRGVVTEAMVSWVDLTPTILDFAGVLDAGTGQVKSELLRQMTLPRTDQNTPDVVPGNFHGRSFLNLLDQEQTTGWDVVYASHTFHEITMYYPMRVVRQRKWKLIWNIAHDLPYPFASDLWVAPTWQEQYQKGMDAMYGPRTVGQYIHRPEFELFDIENDPWESKNLANDPAHSETLEQLKAELKQFQEDSKDPWIMKWSYE